MVTIVQNFILNFKRLNNCVTSCELDPLKYHWHLRENNLIWKYSALGRNLE